MRFEDPSSSQISPSSIKTCIILCTCAFCASSHHDDISITGNFHFPQQSGSDKHQLSIIEPETRCKNIIMPLLMQNPKPRVILGTMTIGPDESSGARITSIDVYNKCLDYFQAEGYDEIDTARTYIGGKQEAFTSEAHWKERGLTLATKSYPIKPGDHKPEVIKEQLNTSLKELKTDCVDIFYLHAADRSVPFEETLEAVNELHKEGKFVQLGLSNFAAFEVAEVVITCKERGWVRPTIYQGVYNAISKDKRICDWETY